MAANLPPEDAAWMHGHAHEPNPLPPDGDGGFVVHTAGGVEIPIAAADLAQLPFCEVPGCLIVSTGHGTSGPFTFGGVRLADLLAHTAGSAAGLAAGQYVDVISADGFGTRLQWSAIAEGGERPILLAYRRDGRALQRADGLVRLIVPEERDDALRQVKWIARIAVY